MAHTTQAIRNIALAGHAGAGKTELTEALLHAAGKTPNKGSVDAGTTVSDSAREIDRSWPARPRCPDSAPRTTPTFHCLASTAAPTSIVLAGRKFNKRLPH